MKRRRNLALLIYLVVVAFGLGCAKAPSQSAPTLQPPQQVLNDEEKIVGEIELDVAEQPTPVTVGVRGEHIFIRRATDHEILLNNPFGMQARVNVAKIIQPGTPHLLVTSSDDRVTLGWVLIPTKDTFVTALSLRVDEGISVVQNEVKASFREYSGDGYHIVSVIYFYNSNTGSYEKRKT